jgi:hypothetical protein
MRAAYVGDASNLRARVRQHCGGNVEASALRKHVAAELGLGLTRERRASGSTRTRIDLPAPKEGERQVSAYLGEGVWRAVVCASAEEARDAQWFAIDALAPYLNRERRVWDACLEPRYAGLLTRLREGEARPCGGASWPTTPGVYAFWRD